jgi:hypothetical protein
MVPTPFFLQLAGLIEEPLGKFAARVSRIQSGLRSQNQQVTRHHCRHNSFASAIQLRFRSNNVLFARLIVADERQIECVLREASAGVQCLEGSNYLGCVTAHEDLEVIPPDRY